MRKKIYKNALYCKKAKYCKRNGASLRLMSNHLEKREKFNSHPIKRKIESLSKNTFSSKC